MSDDKRKVIDMEAKSVPADLQLFMNHIYEFKKGVRNMVLFTMSSKHEEFATKRLESNGISYIIQRVTPGKINLFFGKTECMDVIRQIVIRPLNQLSPEEDFIIGAMLGYDICQQCTRFCDMKQHSATA